MKSKFKYIYGPVPSRRLGRSLGIDLVPFKVCNYDCIYCQLGRTINKTMERKEYVSPKDILSDFRNSLKYIDQPDYITIAGSGEPTLNSALGEIVSKLKELTNIPLAILTNGSLLHLPEVRKACLPANLIIPSLDAGDPFIFQHINRPHKDIEFERMVNGLIKFRKEYSGTIWLEVFLLAGINSIQAEVIKIKKYIDEINPDKIQINTVARPPAEDYAFKCNQSELIEFCKLLGEKAEITVDFSQANLDSKSKIKKEDVLVLISRRPCSIEDIAQGLNSHPNEVIKYIEMLLSDGAIKKMRHSEKIFYLYKPKETINEKI